MFHKPFSGVHVANAIAYGQTDETPPLHEAASWRLAVALGPPWDEIVTPCVLREYAGEDGSLSLRATGWPRDPAPTLNPTWCLPAAFFDALIAQQDRHDGNWRWDGNRLTVIDHGYTFALPRAILNYSDFVVARHRHGAASLLTDEHDALTRLLSDSDLLGMARFLLPTARTHWRTGHGSCCKEARFCALESSEMPGVRSVLRGSIITQGVNYRTRRRRESPDDPSQLHDL